jgi:hypothetical protein
VAGTRAIRTIVAFTSTATATPSPSWGRRHQLLCLFSLRSPVRWQAGGSLNLIVGRGPVAVKGHEALAFVWASQPRGISFP